MQLCEINIRQVMIFWLYTIYEKYDMIKISNQTKKNRKYYHKCSNNFAGDCITVMK